LLGLFLGAIGAAVQREPWNEPVHWANIIPTFVVLPIYFAAYAASGYGLGGVVLAICLVTLCQAVAFNGLFYVLYRTTDRDFIVTPVGVLFAYLALFVGLGLFIRLVRWVIERENAPAAEQCDPADPPAAGR
jgi:hypothetical protein